MQNDFFTAADLRVFAEEFAGRLPAKIFDNHVHIAKKSSYENGNTSQAYLKPFGGEFTVQQFFDLTGKLLPGVEMSLCGFGCPGMAADRSDAADIGVDNQRVFALRLLSAYDDVEAVERDIDRYQLCGVKPYSNMAYKEPGRDVELLDFFSPEQLAMLNRRKLITVVHIPRKMRLEDPLNRQQMAYLCETYPDITFIFAHIGRAYYQRCATGYVEEFIKYPNAYFDTAMINHEGVLRYTFDHFPHERILFGSDMPIALLHGKSVEINHQYMYISSDNFDLGTFLYDNSNQITYVPFIYEQLRSVLSLNLDKKILEDFFYNNAYNLYRKTAGGLKK